jgi:hypothetical protein
VQVPLALQRLRAAREDRAKGKGAHQRSAKYLEHLAAAASWNRVAAHPIDMRSAARWSTGERPVLMRGWESRDNAIRATTGCVVGRNLFVHPEAESFSSRVAPTPGPDESTQVALRNLGETVSMAEDKPALGVLQIQRRATGGCELRKVLGCDGGSGLDDGSSRLTTWTSHCGSSKGSECRC